MFDLIRGKRHHAEVALCAFDLLELRRPRPAPLAHRGAQAGPGAASEGRRQRHRAQRAHYEADGAIVFREACTLGCEGIVSKRLGSPYRSGRSKAWLKIKNPAAPAVRREAEEDWG